ncbi:proton channel OtopLc-like isoform X10 [Macrobrachium nipponense]|uniref:proton channel OtopLc-like isoform X10 n=1 Tax=Macrobrachium nipponense TaxID=159736 RepID=UPI0030C83A9A
MPVGKPAACSLTAAAAAAAAGSKLRGRDAAALDSGLKQILRRASLAVVSDRRPELVPSTDSWDRRSSVYSAGSATPDCFYDSNYRLQARETSLLDSLTYERALTQLAREQTLNSLSTLRSIESQLETVYGQDVVYHSVPRKQQQQQQHQHHQSSSSGGAVKEDKQLLFRLSAVSSASSGPAANVTDVSISDISTTNLPLLNSSSSGRRDSCSFNFKNQYYPDGKPEMVLVSPLTPTPSPRAPGDVRAAREQHQQHQQHQQHPYLHRPGEGKEMLLSVGERRSLYTRCDQPRKGDFYLSRPLSLPDNEGGGGSEYPYLREMKERLLLSRDPPLASMDESSPHDAHDNQMLEVHQTPVGTVVKLNADGYGSHTSPTHRVESYYTGTLESRRGLEFYPKNAKTSTFITLSLLYATLLVVVCLGFVLSEVLTHNVPLYYYEAFFTYLYGISILFLLYVLCYLLSDSARDRKPKKPQVFMGHHSGQYNVSEYEYYAYNEGVLQKVRQTEGIPDGSPTQEKLTSSTCSKPKKHKTSDNEHSHGSFFLRIGAIAFGLGTMIYNGLEFGVFFEIPMVSPCYQILRGVNPLLQLVFTFMQMYFIFMNARLNIHKFKFLARFGLMHIVATNLCVWVRTLVRESLKEINEFKVAQGQKGEDYMILEGIRRALANRGLMAPNRYLYNLDEFVEMQEINETLQQADTTGLMTEEDIVNRTCERVEIMGSIVSDSAPYLYPFIVEYSLIGASVLYIMWKHIGRNPSEIVHSRFVYDPEVAGDGISVASRRCHSRVDCVGASKGLFCGLLVLVASLICLILFFVLVNRDELRMLAIYLADCSHCGIMFFSIIAIFIGFVRVRQLKFHGEREEELDDILLMVSAFGLFAYAVFSSVAGSLSAYTKEPNLLVMVTGILSVLQVIIQMVFIKDTQRRQVSLPEHERTKPGRQVVTFLLICNLTMWVIYTFETQKVEANPVQLEFFGELPWTILLRCTLPLAIFHRFHSTVVLAAIWKNSYKTRIE